MSQLRLDWATHEATRKACEEWHYAGVLPTGKLVKIGVWEDGRFQGVVVFSRGASPFLGRKFDLDHIEIAELTRVALRGHDAPVSKIVAVAMRMLKRQSPGLRLVVSFADPARDHHGGIYQAGNWIYTGPSGRTIEIFMDGRWRHVRGAYHEAKARGIIANYQDAKRPGSNLRITPGKHRYVYPLDTEMRELAELQRLPYPKASVRSLS